MGRKKKTVTFADSNDTRKGTVSDRQKNRGHVREYRKGTWIGVGTETWSKTMKGESMGMNKIGHLEKRLWLFGDSLLRGVGREIHFLSTGYFKIMDRCIPGATIRDIRNTVVECFNDVQPEDLVVIEGGGNRLEKIGEQKTIQMMESIVKIIKNKVKESPLVMCIPIRRREEPGLYGTVRRRVNMKCLEMLDDWSCDGLRLNERMNWGRVWQRDGVHLSSAGKVWVARNMVEWPQYKETTQIKI